MRCPICASGDCVPAGQIAVRKEVRERLAHSLPMDEIPLRRCLGCRSIMQVWDCPTEVYLEWYRSDAYRFERTSGFSSNPAATAVHALRALDQLLAARGDAPGQLLDVGCGRGIFIAAVRSRTALDCVGCEVSAAYAVEARKLTDSPIIECDFLDIDVGGNDVICFWDVFEHFVDPNAAIEHAKALLAPRGYVAIEVPNAASIFARLLRRKWWFGFEHVYYYTSRGLRALLKRHGFEVQSCCSDNADLLTRESLARLRFCGEDAVWGRDSSQAIAWSADQVSTYRASLEKVRCRPQSMTAWRRVNAWIGGILNKGMLGDQLRVVARRQR